MRRGPLDAREFLALPIAQGSRVLLLQRVERMEIASGKVESGHVVLGGAAADRHVTGIRGATAFQEATQRGEQCYRAGLHPFEIGPRLIESVRMRRSKAQ